ncbi:hypothetical protein Fot_05236 [Forsythia ovata]|uniref:Uncharacterized protein n=1 Tax=Forsythia ovata TaxID=205694 RepID=A0ABD1WPK1_9LAMI
MRRMFIQRVDRVGRKPHSLAAEKASFAITYGDMAPIFDLVRDIDTMKINRAITVRVVRVYEQMRYTNLNKVLSLNFVSHDKEKSDIDSIPAKIETLVDREVLFKVQVRDQNINFPKAVYTVMRVTEYA